MLRGFGASGVASLGPSSLAELARTALSATNSGILEHPSAYRLHARGQRTAAATAQVVSAAQAGPSSTEPVEGAAASPQGGDSGVTSPQYKLNFSIRPSVLSPLFPSWDRARRISQRRDHLAAVLRSHVLLSSNFEAKGDGALAKRVRNRIENIQKTASHLRQLLDEPTLVADCPSPAYAAAYAAAVEASASHLDPTAREFASVQRGETSPWDHYARAFHESYRDAPRLQPLEVIFSKPDPGLLEQQIRAGHRAGGPGAADAPSSSRPGLPAGVIGPHVDVAGITHTAGKRKASSAVLDLVPGSGQITVNGLPVELYFRDINMRKHALEALALAGCETKYDIAVRVRGGGSSGQAQAVRTAMARALCVQQPGLARRLADMTRWDGRVVERKKIGRKKARKGFTWVKR